MTRLRTFGALGAAMAALFVLGTAVPAHADGASILGGGSGFAALEIDQWRADTARNPYNLSINYVAQGSTFGRTQFTGGTFDYAASDIQYMQSEISDIKGKRCGGRPLEGCFNYVPVSAGGLSFMYNLPQIGGRSVQLQLTRQAACKIFTGAITRWNDPELVRYNPQLAAYNALITPVVRADGAGESYVFSEFCLAVAPGVWNAFVAQQKASGNAGNLSIEFAAGVPTSLWPQQAWGVNPVPIATADGTASFVADPTSGPGSITYVAAGYAKVRGFPVASVQNAAGVFTQPDEDNVTVALGYATPRGNGTFQLAYSGPDKRAYFPSTYSYVLAQTANFDPAKGATLAEFLCYAVSKGQEIAPQLRYARLSSALVAIAIAAIIQIPGALDKSHCFVAGSAPPPPPPVVDRGGGTPGSTVPGSTGPGGNTPGGPLSSGTGPNGSSCPTTTTTTSSTTSTTVRSTTTTTVAGGRNGPCTSAAARTIAARQRAAANAAAAKRAARLQQARTASIDDELARAVAKTPASSGGVSTVWIIVAGLACAMGITWIRRRAGA